MFNYRDKFSLALIIDKMLSLEIAELEAAQVYKSNVETQRTAFQTWIEKFYYSCSPKSSKKPNGQNCHLCSHVEERIKDYIATLIELWKNNLNLHTLYYVGNGFCHRHFHQIINYAKKELKDEDLDNFLYTTFRIQKESMKKIKRRASMVYKEI